MYLPLNNLLFSLIDLTSTLNEVTVSSISPTLAVTDNFVTYLYGL
jgi:hypothetical protein